MKDSAEVERYRLPKEENERIFRERIVPDLLQGRASQDTPTVVVLVGQPGAGKSRVWPDRPTGCLYARSACSAAGAHNVTERPPGLLPHLPPGTAAAIPAKDFFRWAQTPSTGLRSGA